MSMVHYIMTRYRTRATRPAFDETVLRSSCVSWQQLQRSWSLSRADVQSQRRHLKSMQKTLRTNKAICCIKFTRPLCWSVWLSLSYVPFAWLRACITRVHRLSSIQCSTNGYNLTRPDLTQFDLPWEKTTDCPWPINFNVRILLTNVQYAGVKWNDVIRHRLTWSRDPNQIECGLTMSH